MAAETLELREDECVLETAKGDYWREDLLGKTQVSGRFTFTDQRIIFDAGLIKKLSVHYEWWAADLKSAELCLVGVMPTGIRVETVEGKKLLFSLMGRKKYLAAIQQMLSRKT